MLFIRSLIFAILHGLTAVLFALTSVLVRPLSFRWRYKIISQWAISNLWMLKWICGIHYQVHGREKIPKKASIILCQHQSSWETLALQAIFPPQVWVLKRELLRIPFFGWGLASLNPIAIDRKAGRKALNQVVEQGKARLEEGAWVVIFPEGTRMPPGTLGKFGMGGAFLAIETGYSVVPVAHNAGTVWPKHGFLKHPGKITITIGDPIEIDNDVISVSSLNRQVFQWMEQEMVLMEQEK